MIEFVTYRGKVQSGYPGAKAIQSGFTLIELVMVIVLLGILTVYAAPRLDIGVFSERAYYEQALVALRFGQKQAVSANCVTEVKFNSTSQCEVIRKSGCAGLTSDLNLPNPATSNNNFCNAGVAGAISGSNSFLFDAIGRASGVITIDGRIITVHANTGFIQEP